MKKFIVIWWVGFGFFANGQEVNKEFTKLLLNEEFDQAEKNWNSTFNADNLFIAQNGYFELFRKSKKSGYYLFPKVGDEYAAFKLETSVKFSDYSNNKQSAGLIMMANSETGGGLSVEINQKKEYRIVRVYKDRQVPINGSGQGWRKASYAITKTENLILIKSYDKVYDLYINGQFIQSFTDIELNKGKIGIYVGPDSKVKFDYLKIHGEEKTELADIDVSNAKGEEKAFTEIILRLKEQIIKKDKELDDYKTRLKLCETGGVGKANSNDTALINQRNRLQAKLIVLEEENDALQFQLFNLEEELKTLQEFKKGVENGSDGDIVINLTNMVSNQKQTIEGLESKNKSLNEENNSLFIETKDLSKQLDVSTNALSALKASQQTLKRQNDSLMLLLKTTQDSLNRKNTQVGSGNQAPEKELTEEEKLKQMIEREREERRKKKEEEERRRREEEESGNG